MTSYTHRFRLTVAPALALALCLTPVPAQESRQTAQEVVSGLAHALREIGQVPGGAEARPAWSSSEVARFHDFPGIARELAGTWWSDLDEAQRSSLTETVAALGAATYAGRLRGLAGLSLAVLEESVGEDGTRAVSSRLSHGDPASAQVPLTFVLREADGAWRVVDVLIDGSSALELERQRWSGYLEARDLPSWIAALEAETASFDASPTQVVERLHAALLEAMRSAKQRAFPERLARLKPVVEATHDLAGIAKLTVSRAWEGFTEKQRADFLEAFRELTLATYAGRFDGFAGEQFVCDGEREVRGAMQVACRLERPGKEPLRFEYLLRRTGGRWRILNIVVDGVSDLSIKRSEYAAVLDREGYVGLVAKLHTQAAGQGDD